MPRVYTDIIKSCQNCPNVREDMNKTRLECRLTEETICWAGEEDTTPIPSTCRLDEIHYNQFYLVKVNK